MSHAQPAPDALRPGTARTCTYSTPSKRRSACPVTEGCTLLPGQLPGSAASMIRLSCAQHSVGLEVPGLVEGLVYCCLFEPSAKPARAGTTAYQLCQAHLVQLAAFCNSANFKEALLRYMHGYVQWSSNGMALPHRKPQRHVLLMLNQSF